MADGHSCYLFVLSYVLVLNSHLPCSIGNQVAEWVTNTYFERNEDEIAELEKSKARIPMVFAKRIINQAQQALRGNFPKYGVEVG